MTWLLGQISDLHITPPGCLAGDVVDTAPYLVAAVRHLNTLDPQPDLVLASGDLTESGDAASYERLAELLAPLRAPHVLLPGNHDDRDALRAAFPDQPWSTVAAAPERLVAVIDGEVRLVLLDSVIPGRPGGRLGERQLAWLDGVLAEAGRPVVIGVHHPPFRTGISHMDAMGLEDAGAMAQVVEGHPHVQAVVCGHLHRPIATRWAGTIALTVPGVAHQVALDFRPNARVAFAMEPPAVALHRWDGALVSHLSPIGEWPTAVLHES